MVLARIGKMPQILTLSVDGKTTRSRRDPILEQLEPALTRNFDWKSRPEALERHVDNDKR